jgi:cation transport regulator ChaC
MMEAKNEEVARIREEAKTGQGNEIQDLKRTVQELNAQLVEERKQNQTKGMLKESF